MKNLKKLSRKDLSSILGGDGAGFCMYNSDCGGHGYVCLSNDDGGLGTCIDGYAPPSSSGCFDISLSLSWPNGYSSNPLPVWNISSDNCAEQPY